MSVKKSEFLREKYSDIRSNTQKCDNYSYMLNLHTYTISFLSQYSNVVVDLVDLVDFMIRMKKRAFAKFIFCSFHLLEVIFRVLTRYFQSRWQY